MIGLCFFNGLQKRTLKRGCRGSFKDGVLHKSWQQERVAKPVTIIEFYVPCIDISRNITKEFDVGAVFKSFKPPCKFSEFFGVNRRNVFHGV